MKMPLLNCLATTCVHNKEEYCSKNDIKVGGSNATSSDQTCCESFEERREGSMTNCASCGTASEKTDVCCKACDCDYNEAEHCHAGKIGIAGSNACKSDETKCGTFKCGCK